ncbi:MAG: hypothetical protein CME38_11460 [Haliea sp.]|nr:hypothetical protein [Haliea sp.]|tara:strand:- start:671 stop:1033 length:363 start_codon:yes stop_codon:yes gene_type:complete
MRLTLPLVFATLLAVPAFADDDRVEHYKGEPSRSLEEALQNLSEYNGRLKAVLEGGELAGDDFHDIHQITYTLENALERLEDELDAMEDDLEIIHQASERGEADKIEAAAPVYFERADKL